MLSALRIHLDEVEVFDLVLIDKLRERHAVHLSREMKRETKREENVTTKLAPGLRDHVMTTRYLPALRVIVTADGGHAVTAATAHGVDAGLVHDALPEDGGVVLQARVEGQVGAHFVESVWVGFQRITVLGLLARGLGYCEKRSGGDSTIASNGQLIIKKKSARLPKMKRNVEETHGTRVAP